MCRRPQLLMILSCLVVLGCQDTESSPASDGASASETEVLSDGVAEVDAGPQLPPLAGEELALDSSVECQLSDLGALGD